ncbi:GNAT family N-acetyltransferase [Sphaerisporangium sp. NPDC005288]|uniref:GNAT family N-acetyltransferase n=1 Tax=Sphaerisporangium sp. NPDC005288 TaxID=3155114 RepID=UPI0033BAE803
MGTNVQSFAVANLRRRPVVVEVGGFVVGVDPSTTSPFINYATPLPGARPTGRDVAALIDAFRERGLKPRLEFAPDAAPAVEAALSEAGFTVEEVHEYLVCTPATLTMPPTLGELASASTSTSASAARSSASRSSASTSASSSTSASGTASAATSAGAEYGWFRVESPSKEAEYRAIDAALAEAFSGVFASSPEGAARLRRTEDDGGAVRFVRASEGGCAGAAMCSAPAEGTAELAGVGTRPAFRGRGIAAAVTAALTETMFARGARSVWLEYSGDGSRRVYERVGFRPEGTRLYMSLEPADEVDSPAGG